MIIDSFQLGYNPVKATEAREDLIPRFILVPNDSLFAVQLLLSRSSCSHFFVLVTGDLTAEYRV